MRSRDEDESENDSGKANQRDIKFKVRHIAKIGTERESTSERNEKSNRNKIFIIKMKYPVGEFTKFKFMAPTLPDRDSALLAIKGILDQGTQNVPTKSQSIEFETRSHQSNVKSLRGLQISEQRDPSTEEDDSLDIPAPNRMDNTDDDDDIFYDTRDDTQFERQVDSEREGVNVFGKSSENRSFQKGSSHSRPFENAYSRPSTPQHKMNRNRPKDFAEKKTTDNSRRTATSDMAGPSKPRLTRAQRLAETRKLLKGKTAVKEITHADRVKSAMKEMTDSETNENKFGGFKDVDISKLAPNFAAPEIGPWCTDDICTASLRNFADSMTGIFEVSENRGQATANHKQRAKAEEYITGFLGNNANMGDLFSVKDLWEVAARKHATGKEIKRLQNRARKSSGQAIRLQNLRKQMTFKGANTRDVSVLQTISSFDDAVRKARENKEDELLYYDSDPEDARERTVTKGPRKAMARRADSKFRGKRGEALDILDTSRSLPGRKYKRSGQDVLSDIIETTKNERLTLLWHPTQESDSNMPPVCVNVWVESGIYMTDGSFLLPKLTWLPAHEKKVENRELNVSDKSPGSLDLLDVCRVKECETIDRKLHPFAFAERSFVIQTQTGRYVFECQSKQERGRIVNGLKLVIARLASLLMLKDLRAVDEFFGGNAVPGEAPIWARGYEKKDPDGFPCA